MDRLRDLLAAHPGGFPLSLALDLPGGRKALLEPDSAWAVDPTPDCLAAIEAIWGRNAVAYDLRSDAIYADPKRNRRRYGA